MYPHIESKYLLQLCARIGPILEEKFPPPIKGIVSLLGAGRHSLLRKSSTSNRILNIPYYASRKHGMPLTDQITYTVHNIGKGFLNEWFYLDIVVNLQKIILL